MNWFVIAGCFFLGLSGVINKLDTPWEWTCVILGVLLLIAGNV